VISSQWKREPAFHVTTTELQTIDKTLERLASKKAPADRIRRASLTHRRNQLVTTLPYVERGIRYLLTYQYLLFPSPLFADDRRKHLITSMQVYARRSFERRAIGGALSAWVPTGEKSRFVFGFSLPRRRLHAFLTKTFGTPNILALADDNRAIIEIAADLITSFVIPELILNIVVREYAGRLTPEEIEEQELFNLYGWRFGPR
jgi:hypothetical protein